MQKLNPPPPSSPNTNPSGVPGEFGEGGREGGRGGASCFLLFWDRTSETQMRKGGTIGWEGVPNKYFRLLVYSGTITLIIMMMNEFSEVVFLYLHVLHLSWNRIHSSQEEKSL